MTSQRPSVLVTGGARRIGAAIARRFGEAGWHVVIHHLSSHDEAEALAASLPSAETLAGDLGADGAPQALVDRLAGQLGDWRALVCSAAVFEPDDVRALDRSVFHDAMRINTRAPVELAQAYLGQARATSGRRVIFLTDQKVANPNPDFFSYSLGKFALAGAIPMLAAGAAGPDDRVYGIAPGAILASHDQTEAETEISHRMNLLERKTGASEIADAALFLASGALANGQTIYVDSGQHLLSQPRDVIYLAREGLPG